MTDSPGIAEDDGDDDDDDDDIAATISWPIVGVANELARPLFSIGEGIVEVNLPLFGACGDICNDCGERDDGDDCCGEVE